MKNCTNQIHGHALLVPIDNVINKIHNTLIKTITVKIQIKIEEIVIINALFPSLSKIRSEVIKNEKFIKTHSS